MTTRYFHDESVYNANDDLRTMWKNDTMQVIKPKGKGTGIMVSDFIEERVGIFVCLMKLSHHLIRPFHVLQGCCSNMESSERDIGQIKV